MSTPHNAAASGDIAKTVLMPGDPLRAKFIAETYLENPVQFNTVRNMFGYTGTYKGKKISVMGSGMGMASIGIYSYELYKFYEIEAAAARVNKPLTKARIHSSDVFYHEDNVDGHREFFEKHGCVCVEMESFALFHNAKILNKRAACMLTISDSLVTHAETTAQERQTSFHDMMLVALETAVAL